MTMLLGMLEFGIAFNHQLTLGYATREGARIAADLVNGGGDAGLRRRPVAQCRQRGRQSSSRPWTAS